MPHTRASTGRGMSDEGIAWDEDFAPAAFPEFDFPRRRITGGRGRSTDSNGRGAGADARASSNGRASAANGRAVITNGRAADGNGLTANGNGRTSNGNGQAVSGSDRMATSRGPAANGNGKATGAHGRISGTNGAGKSLNGAGSNGWSGGGERHRSPAAVRSTAWSVEETAPVSRPGSGVPGRRTVTIRGYGAERNLPLTTGQSRRRPAQPPYQRPGFRADRAAMWAVLLGIVLVVVAAASSHAAMLHSIATHSRALAPVHAAVAPARPRAALHPRG